MVQFPLTSSAFDIFFNKLYTDMVKLANSILGSICGASCNSNDFIRFFAEEDEIIAAFCTETKVSTL